MKTRARRFRNADIILAWTVAIIWMAIIFVLSSQPGAPDTGEGRLRFGLEKLAHLFVFWMLAILVANALTTGGLRTRLFWWTFVICALYAVSDELHQALTPGRTPMVSDVFIDMAGSAIGYLTFVRTVASRLVRRAVARRGRAFPARRTGADGVSLAHLRRDQ